MLVYADGNLGRAEAVTLQFDEGGAGEFGSPSKPAEKKPKVVAPWHGGAGRLEGLHTGNGAPSTSTAAEEGGAGAGPSSSVQDLYIQEYLKAMQQQQAAQPEEPEIVFDMGGGGGGGGGGFAKQEEGMGGEDEDDEWEDA